MRRVADAVADLAIAEGVYQLVRGNYDRAAGTLDAFSKGAYPPLPEVASTPRNGNTLTHRVALHLQGGLLPSDPANTRPRSKGEPALAKWLNEQMPNPATVFAKVRWHNNAAGTEGELTPSMAQLGLARVDLFYMLDAGGARDMPGFDDLLIDYAEKNGAPPPHHDAVFTLEYKPTGVAGVTLFELAPLVRALRGLVLGARSLRPTDLALQNEAASPEDAGLIIRTDKPQAVLNGLQGTLATVTAFITNLEAAVGEAVDPDAARDAARDNIDQWIGDYASVVRPVTPYGLQAASLTTAVEGRRAPFNAMRTAIDEVIDRWEKKQDDDDAVMTLYAALPGTATDEERAALLIKAGRIVSTTVIAPLPPTITALENTVMLLRSNLDTELTNLVALRDNAKQVGATLIAISAFLPVAAGTRTIPARRQAAIWWPGSYRACSRIRAQVRVMRRDTCICERPSSSATTSTHALRARPMRSRLSPQQPVTRHGQRQWKPPKQFWVRRSYCCRNSSSPAIGLPSGPTFGTYVRIC